MNIRCKIGLHDWNYHGKFQTIQNGTDVVLRNMPRFRYCSRCQRLEENYGIWSENYRQINKDTYKKEVEGDGDNC